MTSLPSCSGFVPAVNVNAWFALPVDFAAVTDAIDANDTNLVGDLIHHPVVANPNPPIVSRTSQFAAAGRTRVAGQTLNRGDQPVVDIGRETAERFFRRAFQEDTIHGLCAAAFGKVIFQRSVMLRFGARPLEPGKIGSIFRALQQFLVVLDGQNDGNEFAPTSHHFRF